LAATLPSGAIRDNSPSSGFSELKMTRRGAPFHGATGEASTARFDSSQAPDRLCAWDAVVEKAKSAVAISNEAVAGSGCGGSKRAPLSSIVPEAIVNNISNP